MNALSELQKWFRSQCDGDWEHGEGISIGTLDNPGWSIEISLRGTDLEGRDFREQAYGVGENAQISGDEWLTCKVDGNVFKAFGGPLKLEEMIGVFLEWAVRNGEPAATPNGGPTEQLGNSGLSGGPPSVS
jgi:hypothetical protein